MSIVNNNIAIKFNLTPQQITHLHERQVDWHFTIKMTMTHKPPLPSFTASMLVQQLVPSSRTEKTGMLTGGKSYFCEYEKAAVP